MFREGDLGGGLARRLLKVPSRPRRSRPAWSNPFASRLRMKLFTLKVCGYAALSLAATGCVIGGADDPQRPETTSSNQDALSFTTKFSWSQGQLPTYMTAT